MKNSFPNISQPKFSIIEILKANSVSKTYFFDLAVRFEKSKNKANLTFSVFAPTVTARLVFLPAFSAQ